jgi:hypothetical protein
MFFVERCSGNRYCSVLELALNNGNGMKRIANVLDAKAYLNEYEANVRRVGAGRIAEYAALLEEFESRSAKSRALEHQENRSLIVDIELLLNEFGAKEANWRRGEAAVASMFNILEALGVVGDELLHSNALAWLLSRKMREAGSHAQGGLGLRLMLEEISWLGIKLPLDWAETEYFVRREVAGEDSRIDVEVGMRGVFLIHIENKIWATEGEGQAQREFNDLRRRGINLGVPERSQAGIFLTPDGRSTREASEFRAVSWGHMAKAFERFAVAAEAPMVKLFARHYAESIRRSVAKKIKMQLREPGNEQTDI